MRQYLKKNRVSILTGIAAIFLFALVVYNKPHRNIQNTKPDFKLTASELLTSFENDSKNADAIYLNKILLVSGIVKSINKTNEIRTLIIGDPDNIFGVNCSFNIRENSEADRVLLGDTIQIKGECKGYLDDVILVNCFLSEN
ncbi:MAG: hypothetical protein GXX78_16055 [Bacteroidales bacterium]|nr:hypothetical protein [Bacteroidales bacterium]